MQERICTIVSDFNRRHPVGSSVVYRRDRTSRPLPAEVAAPAILSGGITLVSLEGIGIVRLEHVEWDREC